MPTPDYISLGLMTYKISHPCERFISPGHASEVQLFIDMVFQLCSRETQQVLICLTLFIDQYTNPGFESTRYCIQLGHADVYFPF